MSWISTLQLKSRNPDTRMKAAMKLARSGDVRAIGILVNVVKNENEFWVIRKTAVDALGELRDPHTVGPLLSALEDPVPAVQEAAARSLGKLRSPQAADSLTHLLGVNYPWSLRMAAAEALGEIGDPQSVEPLLDLLQSNDSWRLRRTAIEAFGKIKDPVVVDPLITALQDRYASIREAAALALGEIGDLRSMQPLLAALENNKLWTLRWAAAQSLGALGSVEAVDPLTTLLKDTYSNVREAAARALGNIGSPLAITPLLRATRDRDSMVRMAAERALDILGRSLPPTDREKLQVAIAAGGPNASPLSDSVSAFPFTEALTTRVIAERAVQILEALLKDRHANIDPEILRQILHLNDEPHAEQYSEDIAALTAAITQPLDCSGLLQLAQKALLRSGFDV